MRALLVAGHHQGVGKTTVCVGLIAWMRSQGLVVQPFKVGVDSKDLLVLSEAAGRDAVSLDAWALAPDRLTQTFHRACEGADVAVVESRADLFDEVDGAPESSSSAAVARVLSLPVVLVAASASRSAAATLCAFATMDAGVRIAGLVLTNVPQGPVEPLREQLTVLGVPFPLLGTIPTTPGAALPSEAEVAGRAVGGPSTSAGTAGRGAEKGKAFSIVHRGLPVAPHAECLRDLVQQRLDGKQLMSIASTASPPPPPRPARRRPSRPAARIAVACDAAFWRYPGDNLRMLELAGAELVPFSPLSAASLPPGVTGLYLGSGAVEAHAERLSRNKALRADVAAFVEAGGVALGESGGLVFLAQALLRRGGEWLPMCGVLPVEVRVTGTLVYGHVEVLTRGNPVIPPGCTLRGSVSHDTDLLLGGVPLGRADSRDADVDRAAKEGMAMAFKVQVVLGVNTAKDRHLEEGFCRGSALASHVALLLASCPEAADAVVARCARVPADALDATLAPGRAVRALSGQDASVEVLSTPLSRASGTPSTPLPPTPPDHSPMRALATSHLATPTGGSSPPPPSVSATPTSGIALSSTPGGPGSPALGSTGASPPHLGPGMLPRRGAGSGEMAAGSRGARGAEDGGSGMSWVVGRGVRGGTEEERGSPVWVVGQPGRSGSRRIGRQASSTTDLQGVVAQGWAEAAGAAGREDPPARGALQRTHPPMGGTRSSAGSAASRALGSGLWGWLAGNGGRPSTSRDGGAGLGPGSGGGMVGPESLARAGGHSRTLSRGELEGTGGRGGAPGDVSPMGLKRAGIAHVKRSTNNLASLGATEASDGADMGGGAAVPTRAESRLGGVFPSFPPMPRDHGSPVHHTHPSHHAHHPHHHSTARDSHGHAPAPGPRGDPSGSPFFFPRDIPAPAVRAPPGEAIVSLFPGGTEVLFSLGLGPRVVGVSDRCDFPAECAKGRHVVSAFRERAVGSVDALGLSDTASVSGVSAGHSAGSVSEGRRGRGAPSDWTGTVGSSQGGKGARWDGVGSGAAPEDEIVWVDTDWILREGPALVVAPVLAMHPEALASLCRAGVVDATGHSVLPGTSVLQLPMASVHDALEALSVVGRATGVGERAEDLEEKLRDKLARVAREARRRRKDPPRVLLLRGGSPLLVGGEWRSEQLMLAGGTGMLRPLDASEYISWDAVREFDPEVIVLAADRDAAPGEPPTAQLADLAHHKGWWGIKAVHEGEVYVLCMGAEDLVNRPGPRLVDGVEALAHILSADTGKKKGPLPRGSVLKLGLQKGGRCRPKNLVHFFAKI